MEKALCQDGLMVKLEHSCHKVENFIGSLMMLINLAVKTLVE